MEAIASIEKQAREIREREHAKITPGEPCRVSDAASTGDGVWQGDLGLELLDSVPEGFFLVEHPTDKDRQLVPGNTTGSKHCLSSLEGVDIYRQKEWGPDYEGLIGPVLVFKEEPTITHPRHGDVTFPANRIVGCRYQRAYDEEMKRERRARD